MLQFLFSRVESNRVSFWIMSFPKYHFIYEMAKVDSENLTTIKWHSIFPCCVCVCVWKWFSFQTVWNAHNFLNTLTSFPLISIWGKKSFAFRWIWSKSLAYINFQCTKVTDTAAFDKMKLYTIYEWITECILLHSLNKLITLIERISLWFMKL